MGFSFKKHSCQETNYYLMWNVHVTHKYNLLTKYGEVKVYPRIGHEGPRGDVEV